jgi:hypothetical protein
MREEQLRGRNCRASRALATPGLAATGLAIAVCTALAACAGRSAAEPSLPVTIPVNPPPTYSTREVDPQIKNICQVDPSACSQIQAQYASGEILLTGPLAGTTAERSSHAESLVFAVAHGAMSRVRPSPPSPLPTGQRPGQGVALVDVEAHLGIEVERVPDAIAAVTAQVRAEGGSIVNESVEDTRATAGAALSIRVPSDRVHALLAELATVGRVRSRKVETTEIGRKHRDAEVLLRNLEAALKRYEELLAKAQNVTEMIAIEGQLAQTRTSIDRVKTDIAWMDDRVALSTVYVTLFTKELVQGDETPEPKLHPGLHLDTLFDLPPGGGASAFAGAGVSMWFVRAFSVDLDLMTGLGERRAAGGIDFLVASAGGELYSDYLGGGRRRWLNPFFGFRAGYARSAEHNQLALGGSLGVEIYRSVGVFVDLQTRVYAFIGPEDGAHVGVQPLLGVNVAY